MRAIAVGLLHVLCMCGCGGNCLSTWWSFHYFIVHARWCQSVVIKMYAKTLFFNCVNNVKCKYVEMKTIEDGQKKSPTEGDHKTNFVEVVQQLESAFFLLSSPTKQGSCDVIMRAVTIWGQERSREGVSECATCD